MPKHRGITLNKYTTIEARSWTVSEEEVVLETAEVEL
jgi:hypothetical protein